MIHMPRRSVTRFFIPLIDVLLLLFCIFLLMPLVDDPSGAANARTKEKEDPAQMRAELEKWRKAGTQFKDVQQLRAETEKLRLELDLLRQQQTKWLQRLVVHVLDIDGKKRALWFQDGRSAFLLASQKDAELLLARHQREAGKAELYYYFRYPGPDMAYPIREQIEEYRHWFAQVANSLSKEKPRE